MVEQTEPTEWTASANFAAQVHVFSDAQLSTKREVLVNGFDAKPMSV